MRIFVDMHEILLANNRMCKMHFIHYGNYFHAKEACDYHNALEWNKRVPFCKGRNAFVELQIELLEKKGWWLVDETQKGGKIEIYIYRDRPKDYGFKVLWHKLNLIPGVPLIPPTLLKRDNTIIN
jgi:hypothetical protein